jgi:transcription initiation factor IIE alpha subunit
MMVVVVDIEIQLPSKSVWSFIYLLVSDTTKSKTFLSLKTISIFYINYKTLKKILLWKQTKEARKLRHKESSET